MTGQILWYLSRATGIVSVVLLTAVVVLGTLTAGRRDARSRMTPLIFGLHRTLSMGMSVFLVLHIVSAIADGYAPIGWLSAIVPFTSGYETFWVALGTLAVDLLIAIVATSWLRMRLPERWWQAVHAVAWVLWPISLLHGYMLDSPAAPLLRLVIIGCGVVGVTAIGWRLLHSTEDGARRDAALAEQWS